MKKIVLTLLVCSFIISCKTKKSAEVATTPTAPSVPTVMVNPYEQQLAAVRPKFPDATLEQLKQGHDLYYGTCTGCHSAKSITRHSENEWPGILTDMAKKAKITQAEKDAIFTYVNGILLTSK